VRAAASSLIWVGRLDEHLGVQHGDRPGLQPGCGVGEAVVQGAGELRTRPRRGRGQAQRGGDLLDHVVLARAVVGQQLGDHPQLGRLGLGARPDQLDECVDPLGLGQARNHAAAHTRHARQQVRQFPT
jgi:hypothetical protein